jgi:hypothetical protein
MIEPLTMQTETKTDGRGRKFKEYTFTCCDEFSTMTLSFTSSSTHNCDRGNGLITIIAKSHDGGSLESKVSLMLSKHDLQTLADLIKKYKTNDECECCEKYNGSLTDEQLELREEL